MYKYKPPDLKDTGGILDKKRNVVQFRQKLRSSKDQPIGATAPATDEDQYDDQGRKITVVRKSGHTLYDNTPARVFDFPEHFTVFDLFFGQTPEAEICRSYFPDWAIPDIRVGKLENSENICETRVMALRNISTGDVTTMEYKVSQYLYAVLNGVKATVSTFGDPDGTNCNRTNYFVCAYVGDPFTHILKDAYIEYAIPLNTRLNDCVKQTGMTADNLEFEYDRLVSMGKLKEAEEMRAKGALKCEIVGDPELEEEIGIRWFNEMDNVFNSIIYPVAARCIPPL